MEIAKRNTYTIHYIDTNIHKKDVIIKFFIDINVLDELLLYKNSCGDLIHFLHFRLEHRKHTHLMTSYHQNYMRLLHPQIF